MTSKKQLEQLICKSYCHWFLKPLIGNEGDLFQADFVVLSHGLGDDPCLTYGNQKALTLWEYSWEQFTQMPSRLTAEPNLQEDRATLLLDVQKQGFSENYAGVRISASGRRFQIQNATVFNLIDEKGHYTGQAAFFTYWNYL